MVVTLEMCYTVGKVGDSMNQTKQPTEHILACLSSSPSNAKIVRTAATMAKAFGGTFTALYVRTPDANQMGEEDRQRLQRHIRMAEQAGADISTIYGDDIPQQIAEFARISGITKIVLGRSSVHRRHFWSGPPLTEKLTQTAPNLDIYIIPDVAAENEYGSGRKLFVRSLLPSVRDLLITVGILACITVIGFLFLQLDFARYNIIMFYMLGVLFTALFTSGYTCGILGSIASVALYNFFLTEPRLTFHAYDPGYQVTFALMLTCAIITCTLTTRLKDHAKMSAQAAFRTKVLFDTNQLLQKANSEEEILSLTASQLMKLLNRSLIVYPEQNGGLGSEQCFSVNEKSAQNIFSAPEERDAANWTFANKKRSGASTDSYSDAKGLYLALRTGGGVFGVVGIDLSEKTLDAFENSVLLSILGEGALAIENRRNALEKERATMQAQNEQLRANLLRTISHDLRTPLTSISGNASNLLFNGETLDVETRNKICTDIFDDAQWLINLVENLLSITRIENGRMNLQISPQLMDEMIEEALHHINRKSCEHTITTQYGDEILLVNVDARLIMQVIVNLVDNAIKYTPVGSVIRISAYGKDNQVVVEVADNGPGIPNCAKAQVFEMFYTGQNRIADSHRSLGLGLPLCRTILSTHGGTLTLRDNVPHGCVFAFTLPQSEVSIHE